VEKNGVRGEKAGVLAGASVTGGRIRTASLVEKRKELAEGGLSKGGGGGPINGIMSRNS